MSGVGGGEGASRCKIGSFPICFIGLGEKMIEIQNYEKSCFLHNDAKTRAQISCVVTLQLISAFVR